jgi:hypothetical protein
MLEAIKIVEKLAENVYIINNIYSKMKKRLSNKREKKITIKIINFELIIKHYLVIKL